MLGCWGGWGWGEFWGGWFFGAWGVNARGMVYNATRCFGDIYREVLADGRSKLFRSVLD